MADPKELAKKARATLAQALDALQSSPDVPEELLDIAEPIAETMGMLHRIEKGGNADPGLCKLALERTRGALDQLQAVDVQLDALDAAMEAVAGSLSKLFALSKALESVPPPAQPAQSSTPQASAPAQAAPQAAPQQAAPQQAAPYFPPAPQAPFAQPQQAQHPGMQAGMPGPYAQPPQPTQPASPAQAYTTTQPDGLGQTVALTDQEDLGRTVALPDRQPAAQPPAPAPTPLPAAHAAHAAPAAPAAGRHDEHHVAGTTGMPPPPAGARVFDVELGAHSASNFYKGLSGNDVIDHGGIFVATYQIPKVGTPVALKMLLPGDLEFMADAVVQWTRETRGGESDPGFGAKFTRISPEGRQLVYRYVRNREPMFYDDM